MASCIPTSSSTEARTRDLIGVSLAASEGSQSSLLSADPAAVWAISSSRRSGEPLRVRFSIIAPSFRKRLLDEALHRLGGRLARLIKVR
jgi:hypothetical protein